MNAIRLVEGDLASMISLWESTLAKCNGILDREMILQPMLFGLIRYHPPLAPALNHYGLVESDDPDKSYEFLLKACKRIIAKQVVDDNRTKVQKDLEAGIRTGQKTKAPTGAAGQVVEQPTGGFGKGFGAPAPTPGKTYFDKADAIERKLCFNFQDGKCPLPEGECLFAHKLAKKARPRSPSPSRGAGEPRLPKNQVQCMYERRGSCRSGAACEFKHTKPSAAPATAEDSGA